MEVILNLSIDETVGSWAKIYVGDGNESVVSGGVLDARHDYTSSILISLFAPLAIR